MKHSRNVCKKPWPAGRKIYGAEDKAFLLSMQNDRTASIAGKDIKMHQMEMRHQKKKAQVRLAQAEEKRKN